MRQTQPLRVGLLLAEGFTLSAFALFVDHLRLAADEGDRSRQIGVHWSVMSGRGAPVGASCGVQVGPTSGLLEPRELDYVVVVGGVLHAGRALKAEETAYVRQAAAAGAVLVGLCTGGVLLCRAGVMEGRRCCVSWFHWQDFLDEFPEGEPVSDQLYVVDGDRITCAGGAGVADLASFLIERHLGRGAAEKATRVLLFDRARRGDEVPPHAAMGARVQDPRLRRALLLMEQSLADPLPIGEVAERVGVSRRQLERVAQAEMSARPAEIYRTMRLKHAAWLLGHTERSVTDVALATGFADGAHFARAFRAWSGRTPSASRGDAAG